MSEPAEMIDKNDLVKECVGQLLLMQVMVGAEALGLGAREDQALATISNTVSLLVNVGIFQECEYRMWMDFFERKNGLTIMDIDKHYGIFEGANQCK